MPQARVAGADFEIVLADAARTIRLACLGSQAPKRRLLATRSPTATFSQAAPRKAAKKLVFELRASFRCDPDKLQARAYVSMQVAANGSQSADCYCREVGCLPYSRNPTSIFRQGQFWVKPSTRHPTCCVVLLNWSQRSRCASKADTGTIRYRAELNLVRRGLTGGPFWSSLAGEHIKSRLNLQRRLTQCE